MNPFNVMQNHGQEYKEDNQALPVNDRIQKMLASSPIFLFMKGSPEAPMCGFSANTVAILNSLGKPFKTFNILSSDELRQGVKTFSGWPTYPQVYINGQLIGGNDIITEMLENGELQTLVKSL